MKRTIRSPFRIALAAGIIAGFGASLGFIHQSRAELVYEPEVSADAPVQVRQDDREATRQALAASVKAQDTLQASQPQVAAPVQQRVQMVQAPAQAPVQYVTAQPVRQYAPAQQYQPVQQLQPAQQPLAVAAAPMAQEPAQNVSSANVSDDQQPPVESLSKAELMRRERMRTELENEDLLDERLEELRLRDEKRRTAELLGESPSAQDQDNVAPIQGLALTQPQSQVVVSPVTDHPGEPAPQVAPLPNPPVAAQAVQSPYTQAAQDQINMAQAAPVSSVNASALAASDQNQSSGFYISPRAGISSMSLNSSLSGVTATGLYSLGIALGVNTSDNLAFEIGYVNAQYGVNIGQMYMIPGLTPYNYQASQNVIDAMLKLYFLGPDARIRPYIGAGGGYEMLSLNYPSQMTSYFGNNTPSANSNAFLGELAAGLDIKVTKAISVGAMFKYSDVLSSNQSSMYYYGGYGYPGYMGPGVVGPSAQQQLTSASLSAANFYSVMGTVDFSF